MQQLLQTIIKVKSKTYQIQQFFQLQYSQYKNEIKRSPKIKAKAKGTS